MKLDAIRRGGFWGDMNTAGSFNVAEAAGRRFADIEDSVIRTSANARLSDRRATRGLAATLGNQQDQREFAHLSAQEQRDFTREMAQDNRAFARLSAQEQREFARESWDNTRRSAEEQRAFIRLSAEEQRDFSRLSAQEQRDFLRESAQDQRGFSREMAQDQRDFSRESATGMIDGQNTVARDYYDLARDKFDEQEMDNDIDQIMDAISGLSGDGGFDTPPSSERPPPTRREFERGFDKVLKSLRQDAGIWEKEDSTGRNVFTGDYYPEKLRKFGAEAVADSTMTAKQWARNQAAENFRFDQDGMGGDDQGFQNPGEKLIPEGGNAAASPDFSSLVQSRLDSGLDRRPLIAPTPAAATPAAKVTALSPVPTSADTLQFLQKKEKELVSRGYTRKDAREMIQNALSKQG